jgi:Fur family ferric uptake transcriptional regulator
MRETGRPLSHNEVSAALAGLGFDHATIYRNLTDLSDAGLVTRTDLGDHIWRFELRRATEDHKVQHPHFLCMDCGVVSCLPAGAVTLRAADGAPRSMRKGSVAVQVQGRCDQCQTNS